jgi:predicted nuclease with TOPRIM domain
MAVERPRWTDERLDDLAHRMNQQYEELRATLERLDDKFDRLDDKFDRLDDKFDRLRTEFYDTRRWVLTCGLASQPSSSRSRSSGNQGS